MASRIDGSRYDVYEIFARFGQWTLAAYRKRNSVRKILPEGKRPCIDKTDFSVTIDGRKVKFDYAYIMQHGTPGENGLMQGYLEMLGIPFSSCSSFVSAVTFDKFTCNHYLKGFGVRIADSLLLRAGQGISNEEVAYLAVHIQRMASRT